MHVFVKSHLILPASAHVLRDDDVHAPSTPHVMNRPLHQSDGATKLQ